MFSTNGFDVQFLIYAYFHKYAPLNNNSLLKRILASNRGTQRQFSENICSEDDLRSRIFGTFLVKFLACLPLLGFSNIYKMV